MTEEEFDQKSPREIQSILREKHIGITGCSTPRLKFDSDGLRTLRPLHNVISIQGDRVFLCARTEILTDLADYSVPIDGKIQPPIINGTVQQLLDSANDPDGKILNTLEIPFWKPKSSWSWDSFASEQVAWEQTMGEEPWTKFKSQMEYPIKDMRWGQASTAGTVIWQRFESDGQNSVIEVLGTGDKVLAVQVEQPEGSLSSINFFLDNISQCGNLPQNANFEAVVLEPGTRL